MAGSYQNLAEDKKIFSLEDIDFSLSYSYAPFDVRFPKISKADKDIHTVLQPDICVICDPKKIDAKGCKSGIQNFAKVHPGFGG